MNVTRCDYLVLLLSAAMVMSTYTSEQNNLAISCTTDVLSGSIFRDALALKCSLNRELNDNETVVWLYPNCSTIGTCKGHECVPPTYQKRNEYFTLSFRDDNFILYIIQTSNSEGFLFSIIDSFHKIMHTKAINKNHFEDDNCAFHHNLTFQCLLGNVDGSESDCAKDQTTDNIRTHKTNFKEGNRTDNESIIIRNRSNNKESISTESPIPTNDAISISSPTITIPMMFAVVIFVSMLLLTSRLYSCLVQDTNCCRKTHSFRHQKMLIRCMKQSRITIT